jgi:hypothetical protein
MLPLRGAPKCDRQGAVLSTKTGTWESGAMPMHAAMLAIRMMLRALRDPDSLNAGAHIGHLWTYLDQTLLERDEDDDSEDDD